MPNCGKQLRSAIKTLILLVTTLLSHQAAHAVDYYFSGFGTVGYAVSDFSNHYQRINNQGTFAEDSLLGAQMDLSFTPQWQATVQAKFARAADKNNAWKPALTWAFVSWRPSDDLLIRLGKVRIPVFLYTENLDVGMTYDALRMPIEVYAMTPTYDFMGTYISKSWALSSGSNLISDSYIGYTPIDSYIYFREGIPDGPPFFHPVKQGGSYRRIDVYSAGTTLTFRQPDSSYRVGLHYGASKNKDGTGVPSGYEQGPFGVYIPSSLHRVPRYILFTASADVHLGNDFFLAGEFARRDILKTRHGYDSSAFYLQLRKNIGRWVPYLGYAQIKTDKKVLALFDEMSAPQNPFVDPINRTQADGLLVYDQSSWMLGTTFSINSTHKVKAELMRTRVGRSSALVDGDVRNKGFNVFSLSYNFAF